MKKLEEKLRKTLAIAEKNKIDKSDIYEIFYFLIEEVSNYTDLITLSSLEISFSTELKIDALLKRVVAGEPVQYVVGRASFMGRYFKVTKDVLIPRMESEEVVLKAIAEIKRKYSDYTRPIRVLDLGCGTGILGLTIAEELKGIIDIDLRLLDVSEKAIDVAQTNAIALNIDSNFLIADMIGYLVCCNRENDFDVIISNPPYISKIEQVDPKVLKYEPHLALLVDPGTYYYDKILETCWESLNENALIIFETNYDQHDEILMLTKKYFPYSTISTDKDLSGKPRIIAIDVDNTIGKTARMLLNDKIVAIPSETIYGLCCVASEQNFNRLCTMKKRHHDRPFSILMSGIDMIYNYVDLSPKEDAFLRQILPGPVTVILKAKEGTEKHLLNSDGTIGIRVSDHDVIRDIFYKLNKPCLFTSVNFEGEPIINDANTIAEVFGNDLGYIISRDNTTNTTKPSTIIKVDKELKLIREGNVSFDELNRLWNKS